MTHRDRLGATNGGGAQVGEHDRVIIGRAREPSRPSAQQLLREVWHAAYQCGYRDGYLARASAERIIGDFRRRASDGLR